MTSTPQQEQEQQQIEENKNNTGENDTKICLNCGKELQQSEEMETMKFIPSNNAWLSFGCLFVCLCWFVSWIPFICCDGNKLCRKPVHVCPHCYRRTDRTVV